MTTHAERTATAPRQSGSHPVTLSRIQRVTPSVRLLTLALPYAVKFLPGQWVDLFIPSLPSPGGFTITSSPSCALLDDSSSAQTKPTSTTRTPLTRNGLHGVLARLDQSNSLRDNLVAAPRPFIELAVQRTSNPPAQWLWRPDGEILGSSLGVRIGGSFVWPPPSVTTQRVDKVVFIAGGVGINPFMSMLSSMYEHPESMPKSIRFLYSIKSQPDLPEVLFLQRLTGLFESEAAASKDRRLDLYLTGDTTSEVAELVQRQPSENVKLFKGRLSNDDILQAVGGSSQAPAGTLAYVCGPRHMVDSTVSLLASKLGEEHVLSEKWW